MVSYASVAQLVEQGTENPRVVGSIPIGGTTNADLAHLVERDLAKVEVAGSSPVIRSKKEVTFVYQKLLLFLSKPQAWHIITRQRVYHRRRRISSAEGCINCGLMRCNTAC